jgi:predicted porin
MNKKLIAAAVAAAVASPAAFASATMYGKFHTSVDMTDADDVQDNWSMESRASRLGIKGSEDLGNGLKAIYQAEFSVQTDGNDGGVGQDGGDGWGGQRNTFIGLAGGFGTFLVGRHDTPMKVAFYGAGTELLGDSALDLSLSNSLQPRKQGVAPIGVFSEYRADNAIAYVSPNFAGFTLAAAVIPGEDSGIATTSTTAKLLSTGKIVTSKNVNANDRDGIADHYSLGLMYAGGGLKASAGYQSTEAGGEDQDTMQIGGSYTFGAFKVGAHYEDTENFAFVKGDDYTAWALVGKATFGNNALSLIYTDSELDADNGNDVETDGWGVAAEHNFSKRTKVYAAYAADSRDFTGGNDQDVDKFSLGMIHSF